MEADLSKEEKVKVANQAREEVKVLLSAAKDGSVDGVRRQGRKVLSQKCSGSFPVFIAAWTRGTCRSMVLRFPLSCDDDSPVYDATPSIAAMLACDGQQRRLRLLTPDERLHSALTAST